MKQKVYVVGLIDYDAEVKFFTTIDKEGFITTGDMQEAILFETVDAAEHFLYAVTSLIGNDLDLSLFDLCVKSFYIGD